MRNANDVKDVADDDGEEEEEDDDTTAAVQSNNKSWNGIIFLEFKMDKVFIHTLPYIIIILGRGGGW